MNNVGSRDGSDEGKMMDLKKELWFEVVTEV